MTHQYPLVSVCIPAYNCSNYILETVQCFLTQTYNNIELIIVDDGSTDGTFSILKSIADNRVTILTQPNSGAAAARNKAYRASKGTYLIFFDADDLIGGDFIGNQLKSITNNEHAVALSAWGRFYNNDISTFKIAEELSGQLTFADWIKKYWNTAAPMTNPGRAIMHRKIVEAAGLWNEQLTLNDDLEYFTRVFLTASHITLNSKSILYYRSGVGGLSQQKSLQHYQSLYAAILRSTQAATSIYNNDKQVLKSCANMWKGFIYELYPNHKNLLADAEAQITMLGGSDLIFPSGGYTYLLSSIIGWKATKRLKKILL